MSTTGRMRALLRFISRNLIGTRGKNYRLTTKRLGILLLAIAIYLPVQVLIWTGLFLDGILFPAYQQIKIRQPVFIIGNPRSGTTFLQRLLAQDKKNFLSMKTWEIFLSPSITARKLIWLMLRAGSKMGIPIKRRIRRLESLWKDEDQIHRLRLRAPEEDEYLFIHNFSTMKVWSYAALEEEAEPFIYFDQQVPDEDKKRIMDYYQGCIQRHYYSHGLTDRHYLSKNPNFSPAIQTLLERFPDAKFIYLIRNPLDAVPSHISLKDREWRIVGSPLEDYSCKDFIIRSSRHWYNYPREVILDLPADQALIIRFDDLVGDVFKTVDMIYHKFGFDLSDAFKGILIEETAQARGYQSQHEYHLEEMGISPQDMVEEFGDVYRAFDFPTRETARVEDR